MLGLASWDEFGRLTVRLENAVAAGEALSSLDWARVLLLTEITWASNLIGAGLDFTTMTRFSDVEALHLLRGLQRKISSYSHARLLFPAGAAPGPPKTRKNFDDSTRLTAPAGKAHHLRRGPFAPINHRLADPSGLTW